MSEQKSIESAADVFSAVVERKFDTVRVPELGEGRTMRVRSLTAQERSDYEDDLRVRTKKGYEIDATHLQEKLIIRAVVNAAGEPIFTEADMPKLSKLPATVITRIFRVAQQLCGLHDDADEESEARLGRARN